MSILEKMYGNNMLFEKANHKKKTRYIYYVKYVF